MAVITRSAHPDALWPGVERWFGTKYKETPELWRELFEVADSQKHMEIVAEATYFGLVPIKAEGSSISYDEAREGYKSTFTHVAYGMGYMVTREEREDGQYSSLSEKRSRALAYSMRVTKEWVHANILNRAVTSGYNHGDGVVLLSTAHPTRSGNQSNKLSTAADLSEAALEDISKQIFAATNARGLPITLNPRRLVVANNEVFNANRYLNSALQSDSAENNLNALKYLNVFPDGIMRYRYLTDSDMWFVMTDCPDGLLSFDRRPVDFQKDEDFGTENARAKSTMRFSAGVGDWRRTFGSEGAG